MRISSSLQSLAKLTVNFQSSLSVCDPTGEAANSTGTAGGDPCGLQQYCDTGCQTDILGEVGDALVGGEWGASGHLTGASSDLPLSVLDSCEAAVQKSQEIFGIISPLFTAKLLNC